MHLAGYWYNEVLMAVKTIEMYWYLYLNSNGTLLKISLHHQLFHCETVITLLYD